MNRDPYDRYSITHDFRLLDSEPMADDNPPLVFDRATGQWVPFDGKWGDWRDATPITAEEAARFYQDSTLPERIRHSTRIA